MPEWLLRLPVLTDLCESVWGVWWCRFHDFAITKNYAVFMHMPLVFDPNIMVKVRAWQQAGHDAFGM